MNMIPRTILRSLRTLDVVTCSGGRGKVRRTVRNGDGAHAIASVHSRVFSSSAVICAGHSHWKNVQHTKGARDIAISQIITRTATMIRKAAADAGSADPKKVPEIAKIIEKAKAQNIPIDKINSIIDKISNRKCGIVNYELKGPLGIMMILEMLTDNGNRTESELRCVVKKFPFELLKGSQATGIKFNFEEKGVVTVKASDGKVNLEKAEETAIEVGAESVEAGATDEEIVFICDAMDVDKVSKALQSMQLELLDAGRGFIAKNEVKVNDEQMQLLDKFVGKLEDMNDFSKMYVNWAPE